jgi:DNA-directed RNA polymerase sigma subunit (sigma70/sigma32)
MSNPETETHALLANVNAFLKALYDAPRPLSDFLRDQRLSDEDVARLYRDHLDAYLAEFLRRCTSWMAKLLPERRYNVLARHYGLGGHPKSTLAVLAREQGVSRERIRQVRQSALRHMRHPRCKRKLEKTMVAAAQSLLHRGDNADER